ncbi:MAG: ribosomal protein L3 glutamine methyltransferase [Lentisphaeria bacterium]|jgi:ribosomal protein L3 glutamine methyltransferase
MTTFPEYIKSDTRVLATILDWVRWGSSQFSQAGLHFGHGTDNAWDEAMFLLMWAIDQPSEAFDQIASARLTPTESAEVYGLYTRRITEKIPAAYLTGVAWFAGFPFKITQDVLVPRSPIAELLLSGFQPWMEQMPSAILDLCTGSGCIGISCAHQFPDSRVVLSDISESALGVARQNVSFHQLEDRIDVVLSDGFDQLNGQTFDLIISNPPYVDAEDLAAMPAEFHAEPPIGLASGADGLDFARRILAQAKALLNPGGLLVVEVGNSWEALEQSFPQIGFFWPELEHGGHGVFLLRRDQLPSDDHCYKIL